MTATTISMGKAGTGERVLAILVVLYSTGAFSEFLKGEFDPQAYTGEGTVLTNVLWVTIYILVAWLLWKNKMHATDLLRRCPFLVSLTCLALLSAFWSDVPAQTILRSLALIGTTLIGLYFATRFSLREQLHLLCLTFTVAAVLSYFVAIFAPSYGIGSGDFAGDWQGIFSHKNTLGSCMALGFLICFLAFRSEGPSGWRFGIGAVLCGLLVLLSRSATSIVVLTGVMVAFAAFHPPGLFRRRLFSWLAVWGVVLASGVSIAASQYLQILDYLGKDEGLTGRTAIWAFVWSNILERPILGFGYYAFWMGQEGPSSVWWESTGSPIFHSHDAFLDVWVQLGLVGLVLLLVVLTLSLRRALSLMRSNSNSLGSWPFMFLVLMLGLSLTEAGMMKTNNIYWVVYTATAFTLGEARGWVGLMNMAPSRSLPTRTGVITKGWLS
jgi:exopolysaccharide production protein ExoQ